MLKNKIRDVAIIPKISHTENSNLHFTNYNFSASKRYALMVVVKNGLKWKYIENVNSKKEILYRDNCFFAWKFESNLWFFSFRNSASRDKNDIAH